MEDLGSRLIDFEDGVLDQEEVIDLFNYLIKTGLAWTLQGFYGRMAEKLIRKGYCQEPSNW